MSNRVNGNLWQTKKLGEVIKLEYGKPLPKSDRRDDGSYPVYGANGIKAFSNKSYFHKPSIIVGRKGSAGEINLTEKRFWPLDVTYFVTFDEKKYDLKFLYNLLITLDLPKLAKGVKPGINRNDAYSIEVNIPSLPEQKRIVEIFDEVFEKIAKAKENTKKNRQNAKELFESYLQDVFINSGKNWEEKRLGDICGFVRGPFGGSLKKNIFKNEGYSVYEQQHAIYNQFSKIRYFIDEKKFQEMKRFELKPDELIMSCSGTMGKIAIAPKNIKKGIINQALLKLSPGKDLLNTFLGYWIKSKVFQDSLARYSKGTAIKNVVSVKILKGIGIPVPSMSEQKSTIAKLDVFSEETKKLETIYRQKLADLEELKKSVLSKAFAGEL
jgi:type I restriction enzyme, S subunit